MAEDSKGPCISHVYASHGKWPRIESSLLFCNFFYIVKIIEKSLFSEGEIGFTKKKTSKTRNRYFLNFLTPLKKARPFSSLVILMRVKKRIGMVPVFCSRNYSYSFFLFQE